MNVPRCVGPVPNAFAPSSLVALPLAYIAHSSLPEQSRVYSSRALMQAPCKQNVTRHAWALSMRNCTADTAIGRDRHRSPFPHPSCSVRRHGHFRRTRQTSERSVYAMARKKKNPQVACAHAYRSVNRVATSVGRKIVRTTLNVALSLWLNAKCGFLTGCGAPYSLK